jgi:hypothetical protein
MGVLHPPDHSDGGLINASFLVSEEIKSFSNR